MHVTVVGAGALGRIYGARLAAAGLPVSFVVRPARLDDASPIVLEQVNGARERTDLDAPHLTSTVPAEADVVLVTVRFDQLASLGALLRAAPARAAIVVLTPLLPGVRAELDALAHRSVVPAMPGVAGYAVANGAVRYWVLPATSTLIEEGGAPEERNRRGELARHLSRAGLPARVDTHVAETNAATTVSFFPMLLAIDLARGLDAALADKRVIEDALDAAKEADKLARTLGRVVPAAAALAKFVGPFTLKAGVALARRLSPEAMTFVEAHFGPKLHGQHLAMGEAVLALAAERGVAMPTLARLLDRCRARAPLREPGGEA